MVRATQGESSLMPNLDVDIQRKIPWWNKIAAYPMSAFLLIVGLLIARVVWQYFSPFTLIEDEAHYWEWSRYLDWSYYSKGPGVAWTIWVSTTVLGTSEFAIRVPAAIAAAIGTWSVATMTKEHFEDKRLVFVSALLYACVPGFAVAAMVMTIDSPYVALWALASLFALRAILNGSSKSWLSFGMCIAIGFIFKYTILLILPGVILAAIVSKGHRTKIKLSWFLMGVLISAIGLVPVLMWNANHDWATVRHLLGHLGAPGGDTQPTQAYHSDPWTILWMFEYIALQGLVGGPVVILAIYGWYNARRFASERTQTVITTMIAIGLPILVFYFVVSLVTQTEGNWAMAAFVTLIPPAAWAVVDGVERNSVHVKFAWGAAVFIAIFVLALFPGATWIAKIPRVGDSVPLYRMTGMREHAQAAQSSIDDLEAYAGQKPIVISDHYGRASLLAFYLPGRPIVYCSSAQVGGRKTQYDMWTHTDLADPETLAPLLGRPGLLFGGQEHHWTCAFDDLRNIGPLDNEPKEHKTTYIGFNFHTFESWVPASRDDDEEKEIETTQP